MAKTKFRPLHDRVVVKRITAEEKSKGGIIIPDSAKDVRLHDDARTRMVHGLNILADAVKITLGPRGRNVVLERSYGAPTVTKDGV